jgi:hypothetical protein
MAEYTVGLVGPRQSTFIDRFLNQPIFGNAGPKVLRAFESVTSPFVDDPHAPAFAEKKVIEKAGLLPTIEAKAFVDFLLGSGRQAGPASAERIPGEDPRGRPYGVTGKVGGEEKQPSPQVLPMWAADP